MRLSLWVSHKGVCVGYGVIFSIVFSIFSLASADEQCLSQAQLIEPVVGQNDSPFGQDIEQISALFENYVTSGRRLEYRGYIENGKFLVPHMGSNETAKSITETLEWPLHLIEAVSTHMQEAFAKGYANFPIMADMGHGHFYSHRRLQGDSESTL